MKNYKYNELGYAELIYSAGFQTKHIPTELRLVVLYLRDVLKYKPKQRKSEIESFCEKYIPDFNIAKHFRLIDKSLARGLDKKQKLVVVSEIPIRKAEFKYINSLPLPYNFRKVLFALLVQNKLNKAVYKIKNGEVLNNIYFKGGRKEYGEVKKMAKLPQGVKINEDVIYHLNEAGLVLAKHQGLIELAFINNIPTGSKVMFSVKKYEDAGWYFDYYNNIKGVKLCKICGSPFKSRSNCQEYCKEHLSTYIPAETKIITCVDCEISFEVNSLDNQTTRCPSCYKKYRKNIINENAKRYYKDNKK